MEKNILELKIDNKNKDLDKHLKPQWSWKTLISIVLFCLSNLQNYCYIF